MAGESKTTIDHETIKKWAEERNGNPSKVKVTENNGQGTGLLRINFPGYSGEDSLDEISWEGFFDTFEKKNLAFLYQDDTSGGDQSRFFKLITRT